MTLCGPRKFFQQGVDAWFLPTNDGQLAHALLSPKRQGRPMASRKRHHEPRKMCGWHLPGGHSGSRISPVSRSNCEILSPIQWDHSRGEFHQVGVWWPDYESRNVWLWELLALMRTLERGEWRRWPRRKLENLLAGIKLNLRYSSGEVKSLPFMFSVASFVKEL